MPDIKEKIRARLDSGANDSDLLTEALEEITELRKKCDAMEEILIVLARTEFPFDEDGNPTEALPTFRRRYHDAIHEAAALLGLELRSTITRTEPKT